VNPLEDWDNPSQYLLDILVIYIEVIGI